MKAPLKKPAGFRFFDEVFWRSGTERMCQSCGKRSSLEAPAASSHERGCAHYPRESVVRGPDLPTPNPLRDALRALAEREPERLTFTVEPRAVEKPTKAEKSEAYKAWCRRGACCNCGASAPSDPHHEDTVIALLRRGVGTKCRDTLCVSLCRACHDALDLPGGGYRLPRPDGGEHDRAESLAILHDAQEERLRRAIDLLPQEWRIEAMSRAVAAVPEAVLRAALLGEGADAGR